MLATSEGVAGETAETAGEGLFTEVGFDHEGGGGGDLGVVEVGAAEELEVGDDEAEDASGLEVAEDVAEGSAAVFEGEVFEHVGAVDAAGGGGWDGETLDDVTVLDVAGVLGEALPDEDGLEEGEALFEEKGWTRVEVPPGLRGAGPAPKLHVIGLHAMKYTHREGAVRELGGRGEDVSWNA